jgi:hypothetical protein
LLAALVVSTSACGGNVVVDETCATGANPNPLFGSWVDATGTEHVTFKADCTTTEIDTFPGCTGALTITSTWTSTATTLSLSEATCTGKATCGNGSGRECASQTPPVTCTYSLSGETLVITCTQSSHTLTRAM